MSRFSAWCGRVTATLISWYRERAALRLRRFVAACCAFGRLTTEAAYASARLVQCTGGLPVEISWTCHFCGDLRPDARISVYTRRHDRQGLSVEENIRYCNDRPACEAGAREIRWLRS